MDLNALLGLLKILGSLRKHPYNKDRSVRDL